jgi:hypothetical protein
VHLQVHRDHLDAKLDLLDRLLTPLACVMVGLASEGCRLRGRVRLDVNLRWQQQAQGSSIDTALLGPQLLQLSLLVVVFVPDRCADAHSCRQSSGRCDAACGSQLTGFLTPLPDQSHFCLWTVTTIKTI